MFDKIQQSFQSLLWETDLGAVGPLHAWIIRMLRVFQAVLRDLAGGLPTLRAMGLVYTTLLSLVPLLAVSFSVLKGFGVHNQLEPMLLNLLQPLGEKGALVTQRIIGFVDNVDVRVLGSLSLVFLLYTVISLLSKIEQSINYTWRIREYRSIIHRVSQYISVVTIGPIMIFTAIGLTTSITRSSFAVTLSEMEMVGFLITIAGKLVSFLLIATAIGFIYIVIPNKRVRIRSAATGAVVATILWKITGWLFTSFVAGSTNYSAIYSSFAVLVIFMIWLYLSWLILLIGASVAFYHQHPERTSSRQQVLRLSSRLREKIALLVMTRIGRNFHRGRPGLTSRELSRQLDVAEEALLRVLDSLKQDRLVVMAENRRWLPSRSLERIRISDIWDTVRRAEENVHLNPQGLESDPAIDELLATIDDRVHKELGDHSLLELVEREPETSENTDVDTDAQENPPAVGG